MKGAEGIGSAESRPFGLSMYPLIVRSICSYLISGVLHIHVLCSEEHLVLYPDDDEAGQSAINSKCITRFNLGEAWLSVRH